MKILFIAILTIASIKTFSQNKLFIRIYNFEGRKIAKGYVYKTTDSTIMFDSRKHAEIKYSQIYFIRTKHSFGHNIFEGGIITAAIYSSYALIFATSLNETRPLTIFAGTIVAGVIGFPFGAAIGTGTNIFKNSTKVEILGEIEKWKSFKSSLGQTK